MNCKKGDIAILVKSAAGNEGKIVTCLRLASRDELLKENFDTTVGPCWFVDSLLKANNGSLSAIAVDAWLRPIRDTDAQDETLTWAGKPNEVTQ